MLTKLLQYAGALSLLAISIVACIAVVAPDALPFATNACKAYEPCRIEMGRFQTTIVPKPTSTDASTMAVAANATSATIVDDKAAVVVPVPTTTAATVETGAEAAK